MFQKAYSAFSILGMHKPFEKLCKEWFADLIGRDFGRF